MVYFLKSKVLWLQVIFFLLCRPKSKVWIHFEDIAAVMNDGTHTLSGNIGYAWYIGYPKYPMIFKPEWADSGIEIKFG